MPMRRAILKRINKLHLYEVQTETIWKTRATYTVCVLLAIVGGRGEQRAKSQSEPTILIRCGCAVNVGRTHKIDAGFIFFSLWLLFFSLFPWILFFSRARFKSWYVIFRSFLLFHVVSYGRWIYRKKRDFMVHFTYYDPLERSVFFFCCSIFLCCAHFLRFNCYVVFVHF